MQQDKEDNKEIAEIENAIPANLMTSCRNCQKTSEMPSWQR